MTEARTRDEAIATVDHALAVWLQQFTGHLTQALALMSAARTETLDLLADRRNRVQALEAHFATARDPQHKRQLQAELCRAREDLEKCRRASQRLDGLHVRAGQLLKAHMAATIPRVDSARAQLSAMCRALEAYRAGGGPGPVAATQHASLTSAVGTDHLAQAGLIMLDVAAADIEDNPILDDSPSRGTFGKGGLSRADYRWAVQTWNDTVGPGVAHGMDREHFAQRDIESNAPPLRQTADVYDLFMGTDRIRADRRPDGILTVINGRHRLLVARELGIKNLPGQVTG